MNNLKIGTFLLQLREEKELTQEQVADFIGVTNRAVSKWETGEGLPNYQALLALSSLYGVTINEILNGEKAIPYIPQGYVAPKKVNAQEDYDWANLLLSISSIVLFAVGIVVFLIMEMVHNILPGFITLGVSFVVAATCYGCSFIFRKRSRGLMVTNNVLGYISLALLMLGICAAGFYQFGEIWFTAPLIIFYILFFIPVPAVFVGIFSYKAIGQGLTFKQVILTYGGKFLGIFMFAFSLFALSHFIYATTTHTQDSGSPYIGPWFLFSMVILVIIGIVFGIFSLRKHPLLSLIGTSIITACILSAFVCTITQGTVSSTINNGSTTVTITANFTYYDFYLLTLAIYSLVALALSIVLYVFARQENKAQPIEQAPTENAEV